MWQFNKRNWILVIGYSDPEHLCTDIKCISKNRWDCVNKACNEVYEWVHHKKTALGGQLINNYMDFPDTDDWCKFREKLYEELLHWTEEFQNTNNLELTWKSSHLQFYKISVRIFSSTSNFIRISNLSG